MRGPWKLFNAVSVGGVQALDLLGSLTAENHMGILGGTGLAAYLPIKHIGRPQSGEIAFVSGAAGATGSAAAQILKLMGCKVIGG